MIAEVGEGVIEEVRCERGGSLWRGLIEDESESDGVSERGCGRGRERGRESEEGEIEEVCYGEGVRRFAIIW